MKRIFWSVLYAGFSTVMQAHFVFVIPDAEKRTVEVILSETLQPTEQVSADLVSGAKLVWRQEASQTPLHLAKTGLVYSAPLPGSGNGIIYGIDDFGVTQMGAAKPFLLIYYPKTIVGDAFGQKQIVGGETPVELVPLGGPGALSLQLLVNGKPQPDAEVTVILPDGMQKKLKTNGSGQTEPLTQTGRYGAWARYWEPSGGERDGKQYEQTRHYATLVFDAKGSSTSNARAAADVAGTRFGTLPHAASSFGEVVSNGWLYVYGGHVAHTHVYSTSSVSGRFERLQLSEGKTWEELPGGPALQGMNLAAYRNSIYRIGGMEPRNKPGEKQAIYSVADCARFDPATKKWEEIPRLPEPRSSHDVVVVRDKLIVVGGWTLQGPQGEKWVDSLAVLNLDGDKMEWKSIPQPFKRRALMAAAFDEKVYVLGGMDDKGNIAHEVSIYDPETNLWSNGPPLPGGETNGFAPAACAHDGSLYVSVADGSLYRLDSGQQQWAKVGHSTPRLAHRIGFWNGSILISGGAAKGDNSDLIEAIAVAGRRSQ